MLFALLTIFFFFFFNDTATTEIYTLSLHDALPISHRGRAAGGSDPGPRRPRDGAQDRKSTRLNSSHGYISYAVFCLKKKKKKKQKHQQTHNTDMACYTNKPSTSSFPSPISISSYAI